MKSNSKTAFKYAQIKTELSIKILDGTLTSHQRIPSLNDITKDFGVSKITARRVLNDLVAEGLVYSIRGKGSFVADISSYPGKKKLAPAQNLGVVFENASSVFMSDLIKGIDEETFSLGVHVNLCLSNDSYQREAEILKRLVSQGIKKILLFMVISNDPNAVNPNLPLYLSLQKRGIQLLLIDCYIPHVPVPSLTWDDCGGIKKLVGHVYSQKCKTLAYVTRVNNAASSGKRLEGFKEGLLEHRIAYDPSFIINVSRSEGESWVENARIAAVKLLKRCPYIDAILCSDEEMGAGVFKALEVLPEIDENEVLVGGFGNPKSKILKDHHSYIFLEQNTYKLGKMAAEILLKSPEKFDLQADGNGQIFHKVLPVPLCVTDVSKKQAVVIK